VAIGCGAPLTDDQVENGSRLSGALPSASPAPIAGSMYVTASLFNTSLKQTEQWLGVFDPAWKKVTAWVPLRSCAEQGGFVDLAVDEQGKIVLGGANGLYAFDPNSRTCTTIKKNFVDSSGDHYLDFYNNLTFAPRGSAWNVDSTREDLVAFGDKLLDPNNISGGYQAGLLRFNRTTGDSTLLYPFPTGTDLYVSGDLVAVLDIRTGALQAWVTLTDASACRSCQTGMTPGVSCGDCLYTVTQDGRFGQKVALLPHDSVWGLAYAAGKLYGFTLDGHVFAIDPAAPSQVEEITIAAPSGYSSIEFTGAGSTTLSTHTPASSAQ
jgi:hypothetical protein